VEDPPIPQLQDLGPLKARQEAPFYVSAAEAAPQGRVAVVAEGTLPSQRLTTKELERQTTTPAETRISIVSDVTSLGIVHVIVLLSFSSRKTDCPDRQSFLIAFDTFF